jgi:hypothetical protein
VAPPPEWWGSALASPRPLVLATMETRSDPMPSRAERRASPASDRRPLRRQELRLAPRRGQASARPSRRRRRRGLGARQSPRLALPRPPLRSLRMARPRRARPPA